MTREGDRLRLNAIKNWSGLADPSLPFDPLLEIMKKYRDIATACMCLRRGFGSRDPGAGDRGLFFAGGDLPGSAKSRQMPATQAHRLLAPAESSL